MPFVKGQSGNPAGRPKGSRNKLAEDFLRDLHADWKQGGVTALARCREEKPDVYVRVVAGLLPQHVEVTGEVDVRQLDDASLDAAIRDELAAFLGGQAARAAGEEGAGVSH